MVIGILKEDSSTEKRVALSPAGVQTFTAMGHTVYVQELAGAESRFTDEEYRTAGAKTAFSRDEVLNRGEVVMKVSPPSEEILSILGEGQVLFSFYHMSVSKRRTIETLLGNKITAVAYELIENTRGDLTVLQSMSEIAGQVSMQVAAHYLQAKEGGRGVLLGSVPGVPPASVLILGCGAVGRTAARIALGMGAAVTILDKDLSRLRHAEEIFQWRVVTGIATPYNIRRAVRISDVVIGAVLMKAEKTPHLVTEEMVKEMKPGSVIVDVSIDEGGCIETSRPTRMDDPIFVHHNVIHYCVPNIPSIVARTASASLTNAVIPYVQQVVELGPERAFLSDSGLAKGVCTYNGFCTNQALGHTFGLKAIDLQLFVRRKFEPSKN